MKIAKNVVRKPLTQQQVKDYQLSIDVIKSALTEPYLRIWTAGLEASLEDICELAKQRLAMETELTKRSALNPFAEDAAMSDSEKKLLEIIKTRSLTLGAFQLASGDKSNYYIDGKMTQVFSEGAFLIGEVLYEQTKDLGIDAIGGLEVGAVPMTAAAVISYHLHDQKMEGFWVRDKEKSHGTKKLVEGNLKSGSRVVIVDDVITRGYSAFKAVEAVRNMDCEIVAVIAIVDRLVGAEEFFHGNGITTYRSVFTVRDLGVSADERIAAENASR